jgi:hypothetical protein
LDTSVHDQSAFEARISTVREERVLEDRESFARVKELTALSRPLDELLRETYSVSAAGIEVARSRSSCPVTRATGQPAWASESPPLHSFHRHCAQASASLLKALRSFGDAPTGILRLSYDPATDPRSRDALDAQIAKLLERLAREGVVEFCVPAPFFKKTSWNRLADLSPHRFVTAGPQQGELSEPDLAFPRLTVLLATADSANVRGALIPRAGLHIVVLSKALRDLDRPDRRLVDTVPACPVVDFMRSLDA